MATEATVTVPADQFPLGTVFEQLPGVNVELEQLIPSGDLVVPYFWVRGTVADNVAEAFAAHPGVERVRSVDSVDDEHLLRVEWMMEHDDVLTVLVEMDIALVRATGTHREWQFEIRGDDRSQIATFYSQCRRLDIPVSLAEIHALTPIETETERALTDSQQEALVLAYDRGYFEFPRDVTMEELGDELGISQQAFASRLWRGVHNVLGSTIPATTRSDEGTR